MSVHRSIEPVETLWRRLETAQSCPIHQTYDWCRAWIDATGVRVAVLDIRLDGTTAWLLPLEIVKRGGVRVARYIATDFSNLNNGLFSESSRNRMAQPATVEALVKALSETEIGADCILFDKLALEWRGVRHPLAVLPHTPCDAAFQVELDPCFDTVLAQTNAKRKRKKYRQVTKKLESIGGWTHVVAGTESEALELIDTFFRQKGERLKAQGLPDVFEPEATRTFFRALVRQIPEGDGFHQLQMHAIRLAGENDGALCAIAGLSRKGDHFICQLASIDDSLCPDTSPGELLFHLMIERSCADGAALFDLGIGDQRYKRSWCNIETAQFEVVLPLNRRGRLFSHLHQACIRAKQAIKRRPRAYRLANRLRSFDFKRSRRPEDAAD